MHDLAGYPNENPYWVLVYVFQVDETINPEVEGSEGGEEGCWTVVVVVEEVVIDVEVDTVFGFGGLNGEFADWFAV